MVVSVKFKNGKSHKFQKVFDFYHSQGKTYLTAYSKTGRYNRGIELKLDEIDSIVIREQGEGEGG